MIVTVRDRAAEVTTIPRRIVTRTVVIGDYCAVDGCGCRRGPSVLHTLTDPESGQEYRCSVWRNVCRHVDRYPAVLAEAKALRELKRLRESDGAITSR